MGSALFCRQEEEARYYHPRLASEHPRPLGRRAGIKGRGVGGEDAAAAFCWREKGPADLIRSQRGLRSAAWNKAPSSGASNNTNQNGAVRSLPTDATGRQLRKPADKRFASGLPLDTLALAFLGQGNELRHPSRSKDFS